MSIDKGDIKVYDVRASWIMEGALYAEKSWMFTYNRMQKNNIYYRMRNIVKGIIPQAAIEHLLKIKNIDYSTKDNNEWYMVDRYDLIVNGCKYDIKNNFIDTDLERFKELIEENTEPLMDCSCLVPTDQLSSNKLDDDDIYIFCFLTGRINELHGSVQKPEDADSPRGKEVKDGNWLLHCFLGREFLRSFGRFGASGNDELGRITIKAETEADNDKEILIGGTLEKDQYISEKVKLKDRKATTKFEYHQLFFIRSYDGLLPNGVLTVETGSGASEIIHPIGGFRVQPKDTKGGDELQVVQNDWFDLWFYDAKLYIAGYLKKGEFKTRSSEIQSGDGSVKQFIPKTDNNRIYVRELNPIEQIF